MESEEEPGSSDSAFSAQRTPKGTRIENGVGNGLVTKDESSSASKRPRRSSRTSPRSKQSPSSPKGQSASPECTPGPSRPEQPELCDGKLEITLKPPKRPLTAYNAYIRSRRLELKAEGKTGPGIVPVLVTEWREMDASAKEPFIREATEKRKLYEAAYEAFVNSAGYEEYLAKQKEKRKKSNAKSSAAAKSRKRGKKKPVETDSDSDEDRNEGNPVIAGTIPVFSKEFMEWNNAEEKELRKLRQECSRVEEEILNLTQLTEKDKKTREELEQCSESHRNAHIELRGQLDVVRKMIVDVFGSDSIALPKGLERPTSDTVDEFIRKLDEVLTDERPKHVQFIAAARPAILKYKP